MRRALYNSVDHYDIASSLNQIGVMLICLGRRQEAMAHDRQAQEMFKRLYGSTDHPELALHLADIGWQLLDTVQYQKALEYYKSAYSMLKRMHGVKSKQEIAVILSDIGKTYSLLGNLKKASVYSQHSLEMFCRIHAPFDCHPEISTALMHVAHLLHKLGRFKEALQCCQECLEKSKRFHGPVDHEDIAALLGDMGFFLEEMGNYSGALQYRQESMEMLRRLPQSFSYTFELAMMHQIRLLLALGKFQDAYKEMHRISNFADISGQMDALHFHFVLIRGECSLALGFYEDAHVCFNWARRMNLVMCNDNEHPDMACSLRGLSAVLVEKGEFERALTYSRKALEIDKKAFRSLPKPQKGKTLSNMSTCQRTLGNYREALTLQKRALVALQQFYDEKHPLIAGAHLEMGICFYSLGNYQSAFESYQKAASLYKDIFGTEHPSYAAALSHLANVLAALGQYPEALQRQEEALSIKIKTFGNQHPSVAASLNNKGNYLLALNRYVEAKSCYEEALAILLKVFDKKHPDVILTLTGIDICSQALGQRISKNHFRQLLDYTLQYLQTAVKIRIEKNPSGFVRIRLPVPKDFHLIDQIETLRLHYWPPSIQINTVEALHNHPRYFESMILHAGYTHAIYQKSQNPSAKATHRVYRITKTSRDEVNPISADRRNIFSLGAITLEKLREDSPQEGTIAVFPKELIHQVLTYQPGALTLNAVFKGENLLSYFDVFMPEGQPVDPQRERVFLNAEDTEQTLEEIKTILKKWEKEQLQKQ